MDCADANAMADFYGRLLGWEVAYRNHDFILLRDPAGGPGLSFQEEAWDEPPVWPEQSGELTKMIHLDIKLDDVDAALLHAVAVGGRLAEYQPRSDLRIVLDPAGHPLVSRRGVTKFRKSSKSATTCRSRRSSAHSRPTRNIPTERRRFNDAASSRCRPTRRAIPNRTPDAKKPRFMPGLPGGIGAPTLSFSAGRGSPGSAPGGGNGARPCPRLRGGACIR